jgi:hypothetical protein
MVCVGSQIIRQGITTTAASSTGLYSICSEIYTCEAVERRLCRAVNLYNKHPNVVKRCSVCEREYRGRVILNENKI